MTGVGDATATCLESERYHGDAVPTLQAPSLALFDRVPVLCFEKTTLPLQPRGNRFRLEGDVAVTTRDDI